MLSKLVDLLVPPMMSSTMSGKAGQGSQSGNNGGSKAAVPADKKAGRKELEDDQKSEKTIQNKESMS